ncbi:GumC family protein [Qipengyuania sp. DGS5-3]|uniref:GumC family protein n=1 Tax=Qipengyuania sp. DGS5-3 TaxID=3349632 RepID=UPI0036D411ED
MNRISNIPDSGGHAAPSLIDVSQTPPGLGLGLRQYLLIIMRRRWVIAGITLASLFLGILVTFLMTPKYTAEATIEIARVADRVTNFQGVERDASAADQEFYETQYGLLRSRSLAERVAVELELVDDPAFFEMFGAIDEESPTFDMGNGRFSAGGRKDRQRVAGEILLENLGVDPTRLSRLVDIRFVSPDADFSAEVANAWAENFIANNLERKIEASSYGRDVLQEQLSEYKERLDASQRQLVAYASQAQIINLPSAVEGGDERSVVVDSLATFNVALARAKADRIAAEARFSKSGANGSSAQALSNTAINNLRQKRAELAAEYEQLLVRFEPAYPSAVALKTQIDDLDLSIRREEQRVTDAVRAEFLQAREREQLLDAEVVKLKGEFLDQRRRAIQYNIYRQEVDTNQAFYDGLLQRFEEIGVAGGAGVNNVSIVDGADVPLEPSSPRLIINLLASLLGGLMLGAGAAFAMEQLDESIGDPEELERRLGLPLLGSVPVVESGATIEALLDRKSDLVDAYLAAQTSLSFSTENGVPKTMAVTSTRPAEGKSTTAFALAVILKRSGRKVILVDADMRSPSVHEMAGQANERGLSNLLAGDDNMSSAIVRMTETDLDILPAGPTPPNAAELLTGSRLSDVIASLLESYDHVVIDSPPVIGLADAPLIGAAVEGVVYAVEAQGIRSSQVRTALGRLSGANIRVLGGILTKLNVEKTAGSYGSGYDYGYDYGGKSRTLEV